MSPGKDRVLEMRRAFDRTFAEPHLTAEAVHEDLLRVRVGADSYALRVADIAGVLVDQTVVAVASDVRAWLGISAQRGQIVAVYDLAALLGTSARDSARWLAILSASPDVALAFESFEGHLRVPKTDIVSTEADGKQAHVTHLVRTAERALPLLGCEALLGTIEDLARVIGPEKERG
jgi:chemotaxis signal transduction protein